jgi:hypothetical protein
LLRDPEGLSDGWDIANWGRETWKSAKKWTKRGLCAFNAYQCGKVVVEKLQLNQQETFSFTQDELEHPTPESNRRLKYCLGNDENCKKALEDCPELLFKAVNPINPPKPF